jgi:hypothetical protein
VALGPVRPIAAAGRKDGHVAFEVLHEGEAIRIAHHDVEDRHLEVHTASSYQRPMAGARERASRPACLSSSSDTSPPVAACRITAHEDGPLRPSQVTVRPARYADSQLIHRRPSGVLAGLAHPLIRHDCGHAVCGAVLLHDAAHVVLDGLFADLELVGDHPVGGAALDLCDDLEFAMAETDVNRRRLLLLNRRKQPRRELRRAEVPR